MEPVLGRTVLMSSGVVGEPIGTEVASGGAWLDPGLAVEPVMDVAVYVEEAEVGTVVNVEVVVVDVAIIV